MKYSRCCGIFKYGNFVLAHPVRFLTDRVVPIIHLSKFDTIKLIYNVKNKTATTAAIVVESPWKICIELLAELHKFVSQQFT